jgi:uncharacterized protein YcbX
VIVAALHTYPIKGCHGLDHDDVGVEPWGFAGDRRWLITDPHGHFVSQREEPRLALIRPTPVADGLTLVAPGRAPLRVPFPQGEAHTEVRVWRSTLNATPAGPEADEWLGGFLGRAVHLVWLDDPTRRTVDPLFGQPGDRVNFADGYPVLLANTRSLAQLNDWIAEDFPADAAGGPVPMSRFRPNLVISGAAAWAEDGFTRRRIRVGAATFRVPKDCARCVVTTIDQDRGERTNQPLRTLARRRLVDQRMLFGVNLIPENLPPDLRISVGDPVSAC